MINVAVVGLGWWGKHVCNALHANSSSLKVVRGVEINLDAVKDLASDIGFELSNLDFNENITGSWSQFCTSD